MPTYSVLHSDLLPLSQPPTLGDFTVLCPESSNSGSSAPSAESSALLWASVAVVTIIILGLFIFCCAKYRQRKVTQVSDLKRGSELRKVSLEPASDVIV